MIIFIKNNFHKRIQLQKSFTFTLFIFKSFWWEQHLGNRSSSATNNYLVYHIYIWYNNNLLWYKVTYLSDINFIPNDEIESVFQNLLCNIVIICCAKYYFYWLFSRYHWRNYRQTCLESPMSSILQFTVNKIMYSYTKMLQPRYFISTSESFSIRGMERI